MNLVRASAFAAVLILALLGPSCSLFHRSAMSKTPPAPLPAPAAPASKPAPRSPKTQEVPAPPDIRPQPPAVPPPPTGPQELPRPPRRRSRAPVPAPAPAVDTVPTPQPAPPPQLEQILTPQQQKTYNEEIDRNISRTRSTLATLGGRRLNGEQQTYLERIRAFLKQAEEARSTDLFRAKNLAERASLLADDLLRSVQ